MKKSILNITQKLPKYTIEERKKTEKALEEILNRPFKEIKPFLDGEYMKLTGVANEIPKTKAEKARRDELPDYEKAQPGFYEEEDLYEFCDDNDFEDMKAIEEDSKEFPHQSQIVRPLSIEARQIICDVYKHNDKDLQDLMQMLVIASLRFYITRMIQKYIRNIQEREDFIQIAVEIISEKLPDYNCNYTLTTYFTPSLKHAFMYELNKNSKNTFASRYEYETANLVIKSEAAYRAERNLTSENEVSPEAIKAYICKNNPGSRITVEMIERTRNGGKQIVSMDTGLDATIQSSDFENPEEVILRHDTQERVWNVVNRMSALEKSTILARLELIENDEKLTKTSIFNMVKEQHPNASKSDIDRAINTADQLISMEFKTSDSRQTITILESQDMIQLKEEANELVDTLDNMDIEDLSNLFD